MADDLTSLIKSIQKDLGGAAQITNLSDVEAPFEVRLATGIMSLDLALRGGFPAGSIHQIFGPDGSGKDYLSNLVMAEVQKAYAEKANIFWMSFGYKPDKEFMRMSGVKLKCSDDELMNKGHALEDITDEMRGESVGNILFIDVNEAAKEQPAETLLGAVIKLVASNKFQLGIINELGSGETRDNVKKSLHEDARMATWASLMSSFCQKYYSALRISDEDGRPNKTCLLMINPVRANLDSHSARFNPYTQGGGYALKHAKAVDIHLRPGAAIRTSKEGKIGKEIKWKISKAKHGISEGAEGSYNFLFNKGVDLVADLANTAKAHGAVRNAGPVYYILDYDDKIKGGLAGVTDVLRESPTLTEEIRMAVLETVYG